MCDRGIMTESVFHKCHYDSATHEYRSAHAFLEHIMQLSNGGHFPISNFRVVREVAVELERWELLPCEERAARTEECFQDLLAPALQKLVVSISETPQAASTFTCYSLGGEILATVGIEATVEDLLSKLTSLTGVRQHFIQVVLPNGQELDKRSREASLSHQLNCL